MGSRPILGELEVGPRPIFGKPEVGPQPIFGKPEVGPRPTSGRAGPTGYGPHRPEMGREPSFMLGLTTWKFISIHGQSLADPYRETVSGLGTRPHCQTQETYDSGMQMHNPVVVSHSSQSYNDDRSAGQVQSNVQNVMQSA